MFSSQGTETSCVHGLAVCVLGETLQFHSNDIPVDEQEYIFIPLILEKLGMASAIFPINTAIQNPLYDVMEAFIKLLEKTTYMLFSVLVCIYSCISTSIYMSLKQTHHSNQLFMHMYYHYIFTIHVITAVTWR